MDNICWMKGTYYIPFNATVEEGREEGSAFEIRYYQWIPIIFGTLLQTTLYTATSTQTHSQVGPLTHRLSSTAETRTNTNENRFQLSISAVPDSSATQ